MSTVTTQSTSVGTCLHGLPYAASCVMCGRVAGLTAVAEAVYHVHEWRPAGMREVPRWQTVDQAYEALLVCTCGHMEWRRAPR